MTAVFDGHNDLLLRLWMKRSDAAVAEFIAGDGKGHMDLPRLERSGFAGGMFAVFVPNPNDPDLHVNELNPPLANEVPVNAAIQPALDMAALLLRIERAAPDRFRICRTAVMHIEGAECIDTKFAALDVLYESGLRSLGPVWSRANAFGHGVPFRFPSSPDTGPGLTEAGKDLIRICNKRRILVDLSHLNEKGFWDVAKLSRAPLIATHSNAHAISPSSRNLTDDQIRAIGQSGGMIGLNFANGFLRPDGSWRNDTGFDIMLRHLDHMMELAGPDHVGLGSDFEGARIPAVIGDVTGLQNLTAAMTAHGYDADTVRKLCCDNWIAALEGVWGS